MSVFLLGCAAAGATGCASEEGAEGVAAECLGTTAQELRVCAGSETLQGIDVSYYQGNVDWKKVKAAGRTFAFARVSDGVDHPDTKFAQNWSAMKAAGIVRGVYQFFRPAKDVNAQVNLLFSKVAAAGGLEPGDLPPVLDLESTGGLAASTVVARAKSWLTKVEAKYGVKPIIYTAAFMSDVIGENFSGYVLWVANYGATCPSMPSGWTDWKFWQDSDTGTVSGVTGNVDTNFFNGTLADLHALTLEAPLARGADDPGEPDGTDDPTDEAISYDDPADHGATMGSSRPDRAPAAAPPTNPCAR